QEQDLWCWSAVSKSIINYYGNNISQCEIAEYTRTVSTWHNFGSDNCCQNPTGNCNYWNYIYSYEGSIQNILYNFLSINSKGISSSLSKSDIQKNITQLKPFIIRWGWVSGGGHFLVGKGIIDNTVYYMNPWYGEGDKIADYNWILKDDYHDWTHTLTMYEAPSNFTIKGKIIYDNSFQSPQTNIKVYLLKEDKKTDSTYTDVQGSYIFKNLKKGTYKVQPLIEKKSGGINPVDALFINKHFLKLITIKEDLKKAAADVNSDNILSPVDALLINKYFLNLLKNFKAGNWYYEPTELTIINSDIEKDIKVICIGDVDGSYEQ
ncbi:MAG: C39 family peptidase, partial [Bacteroidales bacterium]|nr:C39 family peptidase [Bacteroidales bacterium]